MEQLAWSCSRIKKPQTAGFTKWSLHTWPLSNSWSRWLKVQTLWLWQWLLLDETAVLNHTIPLLQYYQQRLNWNHGVNNYKCQSQHLKQRHAANSPWARINGTSWSADPDSCDHNWWFLPKILTSATLKESHLFHRNIVHSVNNNLGTQ